MNEPTTGETRRDDEPIVRYLPWQEVIRTAHRRALEAKQEVEEPTPTTGTDSTVPV